MARYQVVAKWIVSQDGRILAEAKNFVKASGDEQNEMSQCVCVNISSAHSSSKSCTSNISGAD
ncbi:MAG: hypothetical protein RMX68_008910 [Aulosira sp. ZfuVER01]|nr:hypothetical protein [Aulosira sp. ZfuVER01]MDZ7998674.1 hypothetical protein [Aulosira sp. DedVER01a]MDZ8054846.1 hypothetical protein [Aulosira sp. ZfuCHP01]